MGKFTVTEGFSSASVVAVGQLLTGCALVHCNRVL